MYFIEGDETAVHFLNQTGMTLLLVFTGSFNDALQEETLKVIELTLDMKFIKISEEESPTFRIKLNN